MEAHQNFRIQKKFFWNSFYSFDDVALSLATQGYGVANWYLYNGDSDKAKEILEKVLDGTSWAAFGYIAAEADMKRLQWSFHKAW